MMAELGRYPPAADPGPVALIVCPDFSFGIARPLLSHRPLFRRPAHARPIKILMLIIGVLPIPSG
jgi:hypothetical protein